jgi:predicted O-linked N-acetylglucosamine transferase (SPINDLY family)
LPLSESSVQFLQQTVQTHLKAGRNQQAAEVLQQIVRMYPREPRSHVMLGVLAQQAGQLPAALDWLNKAIAIDPSGAEPYFVRGVIHQQVKQLAECIADYRKFLTRRPNDGKALNNLGRAILDQGNVTEALETLHLAVLANPKNAGAFNNLAEAMRAAGDLPGAIVQYQKAISIDPNCAEAHGNLGAALAQQGDRAAGIASMLRAIAINPRLFNVQINLTRAYLNGGPLDEAAKHCRLALQLGPANAGAIDLMANLLGLAGEVHQCMAARQRAVELNPDDSSIHSNLLMSMHYLDDAPPLDIFFAHLRWADRHTAAAKPVQLPPTEHRKLRIGYVSPNFTLHSVAYFFEPILMAHDRSAFDIFLYSNLRLSDFVTTRIRATAADGWREISGKPDADVAAMIQQDQIDILIDLAGHTADNRLPVFARRPAPIQMTWLGYPATTGMSAIDYRITDAITDPPGESDALHTEKLLRIPGGCWAYQSPESPPIAPFPAMKNGFVTFGSFNNLPKVTPRVLHTWATILSQLPNSRLVLKASGLGSTMGREYVMQNMQQFGIDTSRIELLNWTPTTLAHLQLYDRIDIALDTFPYNGTTTTCEAMWMGVPVITFAGQSHVSRVGAAVLTHAGCSQWIANDVDGYIAMATRLASELNTMEPLRLGLRDRLKASELCDANRLARELEKTYREAAQLIPASGS